MEPQFQIFFDDKRICVLVPTYNNIRTCASVVDDLLQYTRNIIVIVDGATDGTLESLEKFKDQIEILSYQPNKGKGFAIRRGFKKALEKGYTHAITIDSDGQHFPSDLKNFAEHFSENTIMIGSRALSETKNVPAQNKTANNISNFWLWVETGKKLPDTQSGYRLYPIHSFREMRFYSRKYEFEIEVLVRSVWKGIQLKPIPINVLYQGNERVSHFRPVKDFFRISVLNTVLVFIAFLWIKPVSFLKNLTKENIKKFFRENLLETGESTLRLSMAVSWGIFWGIVPLWGFQFALCLMTAHFLKLNKLIAGTAAQISLPPMIPLIIYLSYKLGGLLLGKPTHLLFSKEITIKTITNDLYIYVIGGTALSILSAILFGVLTFVLLKVFRRR